MPTSLIATLADVEREARIPLAERRLPTSTYERLCRAAERYADHIALQFLPLMSPCERVARAMRRNCWHWPPRIFPSRRQCRCVFGSCLTCR